MTGAAEDLGGCGPGSWTALQCAGAQSPRRPYTWLWVGSPSRFGLCYGTPLHTCPWVVASRPVPGNAHCLPLERNTSDAGEAGTCESLVEARVGSEPLTLCAEAVGSGWGTADGIGPGLTLSSGSGGLCCGSCCPPEPTVSTPHVYTTGRSPPCSPSMEGFTAQGTSGKPHTWRCGWKTVRFLCRSAELTDSRGFTSS